jgi:hypothetical protein
MALFDGKDDDEEEDSFVPLKKPQEPAKGPKKPLFGDDSDEESVQAPANISEPKLEKTEDL